MSAEYRPKERDVIEIAERIYFETEKEFRFRDLISTPLGDDCFSFFCPENKKIVVTTDSLFDEVHFDLGYFSFYEVGYRSVAVNVSDLASQGAFPAFILVSAAFKKGITFEEINSFMNGLKDACLEYGCILAGGDTSSSKTVSVTVTAIGFAESEMRRSEAKPGDFICVTGKIGLAAAGYIVLTKGLNVEGFATAVDRFLKPKARVKEGILLSQNGVKCCEDISDGLLKDLSNIATKSEVGFEVDLKKIPVAGELFKLSRFVPDISPYEIAATFGDDYELLFTADEMTMLALEKLKLDFTVIGKVLKETNKRIVRGLEFPHATGYEHEF